MDIVRCVRTTCFVSILLMSHTSVWAEGTWQQEVIIDGLKNNSGSILLNLFNASKGYPDDPNMAIAKYTLQPSEKQASIVLKDLIRDVDYAVSVCHDANGNAKCDTNFIGIPTEGVGVSNNARGKFGPPAFADAKFSFQEMLKPQRITIRY